MCHGIANIVHVCEFQNKCQRLFLLACDPIVVQIDAVCGKPARHGKKFETLRSFSCHANHQKRVSCSLHFVRRRRRLVVVRKRRSQEYKRRCQMQTWGGTQMASPRGRLASGGVVPQTVRLDAIDRDGETAFGTTRNHSFHLHPA